MLAQYQNIANIVKQTRAEINTYSGSNAANIKIMITETDANYELDSTPSALFAADTYMTFLENGVASVDWWDLHNGAATVSTDADGTTDFGDEGLLSNGSCSSGTCEPAADTVFPTYYGLKAVGDFATSGGSMVATTSSDSAVTAYAVKQPSGALNVMLVNHSASASEPVSLAYSGFAPSSVTSAEQFAARTKKLTTLSGVSTSALTLPAYSITVLKLGVSGSLSTACAVTATKTADSGSTFSESLTIKNTGTSAVSGWKLGFAFAGNQKIASGTNATYHQSGAAVLAHPVSGDTTVAAGASVTIGYTATYTGSNAAAAWYALNGVRCTL
jgi:hypothetical protein